MYSYFLKFFTIVIVCLYKQTLGFIHVFIFFFYYHNVRRGFQLGFYHACFIFLYCYLCKYLILKIKLNKLN